MRGPGGGPQRGSPDERDRVPRTGSGWRCRSNARPRRGPREPRGGRGEPEGRGGSGGKEPRRGRREPERRCAEPGRNGLIGRRLIGRGQEGSARPTYPPDLGLGARRAGVAADPGLGDLGVGHPHRDRHRQVRGHHGATGPGPGHRRPPGPEGDGSAVLDALRAEQGHRGTTGQGEAAGATAGQPAPRLRVPIGAEGLREPEVRSVVGLAEPPLPSGRHRCAEREAVGARPRGSSRAARSSSTSPQSSTPSSRTPTPTESRTSTRSSRSFRRGTTSASSSCRRTRSRSSPAGSTSS